MQADLARPLPFGPSLFLGVYSHLGLHYFGKQTLFRIFDELWRVTADGGVLAFCVKSVDDPYYGKGRLIEPHMFEYKGHVRHFLSEGLIRELLSCKWDILDLYNFIKILGDYKLNSSFIGVLAAKRVIPSPGVSDERA